MNSVEATIRLAYMDEDEEVTIQFGQYSNGEPAIQIFSETEGPIATATVNLESYGIHPAPGHVLIKEYSENEGMVDALITAGIITERGQSYSFGFIQDGAFECPLAEEYLRQF